MPRTRKLLAGQRQLEDERASAARRGLDLDVATVEPGELARHVEAEADARDAAAFRRRRAAESPEQVLLVLGRDADALVRDRDAGGVSRLLEPAEDRPTLG